MKVTNILIGVGLLVGLLACGDTEKNPTDEGATTSTKTVEPSRAAAVDTEKKSAEEAQQSGNANEVVFDPKNPPAGYTKCHRNHCHKVGGGVASYKQVMEEMGATKIINVPKQAPMPKAPSDVAAAPADAQVTASGLASKMINAGDGGANPTLDSVVTIHYTGWTTEGKGVDSSVARGEPATLPVKGLFPGLKEGIQLMTVGEERRFWIPQDLTFAGKSKQQSQMLVFDVELMAIK